MLEVGKRYTSPVTGTWVEVVERTGDAMKFERSFAPGTGHADPHLHEDFVQTWDRVTIEPGTRHRDPWNASDTELHARGTFDPCNEFIEAYASAYAQHLVEGRHGRLTKQEEMPLLQILVIAQATNGKSYGGSPPIGVQKAALPFLALFGLAVRGYRASYD